MRFTLHKTFKYTKGREKTMKPEERAELVREIDTILNEGDKYGLISDDREDGNVLNHVSKIKPNIPNEIDIDKLNKTLDVINKLSDKILKQREIDYVEMNKDMAIQLMENHNYGLFFGNPIAVKINNDMEDKSIKIKYRR